MSIELVLGLLAAWLAKKASLLGKRVDSQVDSALSSGMDRLQVLVEEKLQNNSAYEKFKAEATGTGSVHDRTRYEAILALHDATTEDEPYGARLVKLSQEVTSLAEHSSDPSIRQAIGTAMLTAAGDMHITGSFVGVGKVDQRKSIRIGSTGFIAIAAVLAMMVVGGTVAAVRAIGDEQSEANVLPAGESLGPPVTFRTSQGFSYSVRVGKITKTPKLQGRRAPAGQAYLRLPVAITNLESDTPAPFWPLPMSLRIAVPLSQTNNDDAADGYCHWGDQRYGHMTSDAASSTALENMTPEGYCSFAFSPGSQYDMYAAWTEKKPLSVPDSERYIAGGGTKRIQYENWELNDAASGPVPTPEDTPLDAVRIGITYVKETDSLPERSNWAWAAADTWAWVSMPK
jgi:hypothetical protein